MERLKILVVDDNPSDRFLYQIALRKRPGAGVTGVFDAVEADTGQSGLAACKAQGPDCIVLDFNLPDMDGLEFISALKEQYGDVPCAVLMLTGIRDERVAVRAMTSGATDYLPKTEDIGKILEAAIIGAIEKFRMRRQIAEHQSALEASERQYRTLMEAIPQLVWVMDAAGAVQYANRRWAEYTGLAAAGATGLNDAMHVEDLSSYGSAWQAAVARKDTFEIESRLRRAGDGSYRWHLIRMAPMQDRLHETMWLATGMDVEDYKRAESAIQHRQKWESIGLLAGGIAHDFNNLLVGVLGGASYAAEYFPPDHPVQSTLEIIARSGERAAHLTRQLLAYAGKGPLLVERVNLSAIVTETFDLIRASIPPHVRVIVQADDRLPCIDADSGQVQQVVMNLLINGAEAVPADRPGTVFVRTFAREFEAGTQTVESVSSHEITTGRYVVLEVEDTGSGMDEGTKKRIFDPFFTTKFTGRGLGLAAVHGILRSARGSISVESAPSKGSTFRVFFPASHEIATEKAAAPRVRNAPDGNSAYTILVIDDEASVRNVARLALERAGYKVIAAGTGAAGLQILERQQEPISLVLLDMSMPEMDGRELLTTIRLAGISVPVAVCSGYSEAEVLHRFDGCEFTTFIPKPFRAADLADRVGNVLKSSRA